MTHRRTKDLLRMDDELTEVIIRLDRLHGLAMRLRADGSDDSDPWHRLASRCRSAQAELRDGIGPEVRDAIDEANRIQMESLQR